MENYEKLVKIAEKFKLSAEDKRFIEPLAAENGIEIKRSCSDCWRDAAIRLALIYKPVEEKKEDTGCKYELREGLDINLISYKYGKLHICAATLTEENVKLWRKAGIPKRFFTKYPEDESNE